MSANYSAKSTKVETNPSESLARGKSKTPKKIAISVLVLVLLSAIVGVIVYYTVFNKRTPPVTTDAFPREQRVDCQVERGTNRDENECIKRGCVWDPQAAKISDRCYVALTNRGFNVSGVARGTDEIKIDLDWYGEAKGVYSNDIIMKAQVQVYSLDENTVRIKIIDRTRKRFEVPVPLSLPNKSVTLKAFNIIYSQIGTKFYIKVIRAADGTVLFDSSVADLVLENQYLSISTRTPTTNVFGFGENLHRTFRHKFSEYQTWPLFARDQPPGGDYLNLYGVHPFYVCIEDSGKAHGVFLFNSNAQDYTFTPGRLITYRTIGGILDFFVFTGPSPENVVQSYTSIVGRPYLPPYWALGFQICRYGYMNTNHVRQVVERTRNASIPHDVQYVDIDYMDARKDFTIDPKNFGDIDTYFRDLRKNHSMKTIIILDPALSIQTGYKIYEDSKDMGIYVKWPTNDTNYKICDRCNDSAGNMLGYVWPDNETVFPDFFKNKTSDLWTQWIANITIPFDGLWIDMNEPANFDTNKDRPWNWERQRPGEPDWNLKCDFKNQYENPPYKTKAAYVYDGDYKGNLSDKTLCMVGVQGQNDEYKHYDVHNLYGWSQTEPTLKALRSLTKKRGMVITRSTFAGSGKFAGHWLGDNTADWQHLRESIIGMLEFNIFGIPYVGADIGGFFNNGTAELVKRWMQVGAFYPFSRNHNGIAFNDNDPAAFADESVARLTRLALEIRYRLLPYLYTLFYLSSTEGHTVVRSLQFEWPNDKQTWDIDQQFLWGGKVLFSPILYENQTTIDYYLPAGRWYDWYTSASLKDSGLKKAVPVNSDSEIPIHIRGGSIIPLKESALTTTQSRLTNFTYLVALDESGAAKGALYWDDGDSIDPSASYCLLDFTAGNKTLKVELRKTGCTSDGGELDSLRVGGVKILGVDSFNSTVKVDGVGINSAYAVYNSTSQVLLVTLTNKLINETLLIQW